MLVSGTPTTSGVIGGGTPTAKENCDRDWRGNPFLFFTKKIEAKSPVPPQGGRRPKYISAIFIFLH